MPRVHCWFSTSTRAFKVVIAQGPHRKSSFDVEYLVLFNAEFGYDQHKPTACRGTWNPRLQNLDAALERVFGPQVSYRKDLYILYSFMFKTREKVYINPDDDCSITVYPVPAIVLLEVNEQNDYDDDYTMECHAVYRTINSFLNNSDDQDNNDGSPEINDTRGRANCLRCRGIGKIESACPHCDGHPEEEDCPDCEGEGTVEVPCQYCCRN